MNIERKYLVLILFAGFLVALDQITKIYIHTQFILGESVPVVPGYFNITYVRNLGAAFGFLNDAQELFRKTFFLVIPPIAMIIILVLMRGVPSTDRVQVLALSAIFGGAAGNYIDRLRFGFVVDFLDFHWQGKYSYPAFNIADSAIVCGVIILMFLVKAQPAPEEEKSAGKT